MSDRVTVVVVTYDSAAHLPGLLASLPAALDRLDWELVVADNASSDGSLELAAGLAPEARCVQVGRNAGYAAGINAALRVASPYDAALVLNPDVRLAPCAVPLLLGALVGRAGIVAPRLVDEDGTTSPSLRRDPSVLRALGEALVGGRRAGRAQAWGELVLCPADYDRPHDVDWATGAVLLLSADCLAAVGEWDERYFLYSEETDYAQRARALGFTVRYEPAATALHVGGEAHTSSELWALLTCNRVALYRRRHGAASSAAFYCAVLLGEVVRAAAARRPSRSAVRALLHRPLPG